MNLVKFCNQLISANTDVYCFSQLKRAAQKTLMSNVQYVKGSTHGDGSVREFRNMQAD